MLGGAVVRKLRDQGYEDVIMHRVDLANQRITDYFFEDERPEYVFMLAGMVGGVLANKTYPADFISVNLAIATNVVRAAHDSGVKKMIYVACNCAYPAGCEQPMREEFLGTGALEPTSEAFATAKLAGIVMCKAYVEQHGRFFVPAVLCNLYGPGDDYDPENSHFVAALVRKFHTAKADNAPEVVLWGTGTPRREVLYVDDAADALLYLMQNHREPRPINVGWGEDRSILDHARLVAETVGYGGTIRFDNTMPDGVACKLLDVSRMSEIGWRPSVHHEEGVALAYADFLERYT